MAADSLATKLQRRRDRFRNRGDTVLCPLCDSTFARFKPDRHRPDALCWRCGSHERHRAQWALLEARPELLDNATRLLHFAPEHCLKERLQRRDDVEYVTTDLDPHGVDLQLDVTALDLPDDAFDAVLCSHVLEHVPDDGAAMRELRRITAPGGFCLVMVPIALDRDTTYEDAAITTPEDREREFLQFDHVRLYAPDVADRLRAAGFDVETIESAREVGEATAKRMRLIPSDLVFLCRPA